MSKKNKKYFRPKKTIGQRYSGFDSAARRNNLTYDFIFSRMKEICMVRFKYKNLPDSMNQRYLEQTLFWDVGASVFYDEELNGLINLPFNQIGRPDIYENPKNITAYSSTGYHRNLRNGEFEIIWNSYDRVSSAIAVEYFAYRLYDAIRTQDVNINGQKTAKVLPVSEAQKLTMDNINMSIEGNIPYIPVKQTFNVEELKPIDLTVPYVSDKIQLHIDNVWKDFLTWCGVENYIHDKKERMTESEAAANYGQIEIERISELQSREEGIKRVNEHFGTHIEVEFNSSLCSMLNTPQIFENQSEKKETEYGTNTDNKDSDNI